MSLYICTLFEFTNYLLDRSKDHIGSNRFKQVKHFMILNRRRVDHNKQHVHTVKPVLVVTSIKQPTCIKQPEESCPKIHILIYLNCIKPAFSSHILSFPWVAA